MQHMIDHANSPGVFDVSPKKPERLATWGWTNGPKKTL